MKEACVMMYHLFLLNWNQPGEGYKSKHRFGTRVHPSLNFPSCSCYWKMMEDVGGCLSSSVPQRALLQQAALTARWNKSWKIKNIDWWIVVFTLNRGSCFVFDVWRLHAEILSRKTDDTLWWRPDLLVILHEQVFQALTYNHVNVHYHSPLHIHFWVDILPSRQPEV